MKHIFIINPAAGKGDKRQKIYDMADALREKHGLEVECILTTSRGHATTIARERAETGEELRFYACGGDGTINEVANGIAGFENAAMSCIPIGTGNDFLKNFGADAALFADAENLWDGEVQQLDMIDCGGRLGLCIACSGIDARVADDVHKYDAQMSGKKAYIASLAVNFVFKDINRHWTVTLGDEEIEGDFALVAVCNGRYYGGGFMPIGTARMNDGLLNTLVVKGITKPTLLRFVGPYSKGQYHKFPKYAAYYEAPTVRIRSTERDITTCIDGETIVSDDITIRLADRKLNFFGPKGCDPNKSITG